MVDRGNLFLGNLPSGLRAYLAALLKAAKARYERLVIPAVGQFAVPEVAIAAGWQPHQIITSDVSMFSACVAAAIAGKPVSIFGPISGSGELAELDLDDPAVALFAMKLANVSARAKTFHAKCVVRDLRERAVDHVEEIRNGLSKIRGKLEGISYAPADLFDVIEQERDRDDTLLFVNPPAYKGGYEKQFDVYGALEWKNPPFRLFDPKTGYDEIHAALEGRECLGVRAATKLRESDKAAVICADATKPSKNGIEYLLSNRPAECQELAGRRVLSKPSPMGPIDAPILPEEHEITATSRVEFINTTTAHAFYYRDLWAHRLGSTDAERHMLLLIDGYVTGVVGLHYADIRRNRKTHDGKLWLFETYGFNANSIRYPRLNRLLMMLITTAEFGKLAVKGDVNPAAGLATTCLCEHPELKTNRGILKLVSRTRQKKLLYVAEWKQETLREAVLRWLNKHAHIASTRSVKA